VSATEREPQVVWQGAGVVVIDKPAGLAMHTGTGVEDEAVTLVGWARAHLDVEAGFQGPSFLGRLDRPTSGLVIGALTRAGLASVEPGWTSGAVEKGYLAVVHGRPAEGGLIDIPLAARRPRHRGTGRVEEARSSFHALARPAKRARDGMSLVLAFPHTGRTHQLRRHFKAIGHPIVGDSRYGDRRRDRDVPEAGLMLHCWRYRAPDVAGLPDEVVSDLPARFRGFDVDVDTALQLATALGRVSEDDVTE
jgi:23S rRNA-/tRNA-specific pseudouridylate synthase